MASIEPPSQTDAEVLACIKRDATGFVRRLGLPSWKHHLYDEIVQDTLMVADRRLTALVSLDPAALRSWTYTTVFLVARNTERAEMRRTAVWKRLRDAFVNDNVRAVFDQQDDANAELLAGALSVLTEADRQLLIRQIWEGLSTAELAASTGLSEENVRQRLSRARKLARESGLHKES
jgi:RNA polymerase sigma factor (sigma-70 family)